MLRDVPLAPGFPIRHLAELAKGKSGSDLKEMCRNAAMLPVREFVRKANGDVSLLARGQDEVRFRTYTQYFRSISNTSYHAGLQPSSSYDWGFC